MVEIILALAGPLLAAPLLIAALRYLYVVFLQQGVMLFVGLPLQPRWALRVATGAAIFNVSIFACAWWAAVIMKALELSSVVAVMPFLAALACGLTCTSLYLRGCLALKRSDSWLVGLLTFTGGNLPMVIFFPTFLALVW
jgi:hypothetical protein